MSKYIQIIDKVVVSKDKKQEFVSKTLQYKNECRQKAFAKNRDRSSIVEQRSRENRIRMSKKAIIAALATTALIFCAIIISIIASMTARSVRVVIIDASASMQARQENGKTRFENSVERARTLCEDGIASKEEVVLILAGRDAEVITITKSAEEINKALDGVECTYSEADIDSAAVLADSFLKNTNSKAMLITANDYNSSNFQVHDIFEDEWNAVLLDVQRNYLQNEVIEDNSHYNLPPSSFEVTIVSYNKDADITVYLEAEGVNDEHIRLTAQRVASCKENQPTSVIFDDLNIYEYESVRIYIDVQDSLGEDNEFCLFDGRIETISLLYVTPLPNLFFRSILLMMREALKNQWKIIITEGNINEVELKGYDFYIIEYDIPEELPSDGMVWLIDPRIAPKGTDFSLGEEITIPNNASIALTAGDPNPIMKNINAAAIEVRKYRKITNYESYDVLMYCEENPVLMVRNAENIKLTVLAFSIVSSNLAVQELAALAYNLLESIFDYFCPPTITEHVYEIDQSVMVNARGTEIEINNEQGYSATFNSFPSITVPTTPGTYALKQTLLSKRTAIERFYVRITPNQSNFSRQSKL